MRPWGKGWRVPNTPQGRALLAERLTALDPELVVLESTGGLERAVALALREVEIPVAVVNPRQPKQRGVWPRPMPWMRKYWHGLPKRYSPSPIALLDEEIQALKREDWRHRDRLLRSVPGVGPVLSATLLGCLPELGALPGKKIAALYGRSDPMQPGDPGVLFRLKEAGKPAKVSNAIVRDGRPWRYSLARP